MDYDKIKFYALKVKSFNEAGVSNEALLDITILPNDEQKPTIALIGSSHVYQVEHSAYQDSGAIAFDNIDGDITDKIIVNNPVNTDAEVGTTLLGLGEMIDMEGLSQGEHNITLSVFDNDGNEDADSIEITVISPQ